MYRMVVDLPGCSEVTFGCWAVTSPKTHTYWRSGHENKTKLKHHVAVHISRTTVTTYYGITGRFVTTATASSSSNDGGTTTAKNLPPMVSTTYLWCCFWCWYRGGADCGSGDSVGRRGSSCPPVSYGRLVTRGGRTHHHVAARRAGQPNV